MRRLLLLLLPLALAACSGQSSASTPAREPATGPPTSVAVRAIEYRFNMPARWPSGWVTVTLLDDGGQAHQLQLARLRPGASLHELRSDFAGNPAAAFALLVLAGGPDTVEPGLDQQVTVWLDPGSYVALDLSVGADGVQNVNHGMVQPFTIDLPAVQTEPLAQGTLVEHSMPMGYDLPPIAAGPVVLQVQDRSSKDDHEAAIVQPAAGKGVGDVVAFLRAPEGPPPFRFRGGLAALEPGQSGFLHLDLDPGSYVVLCLVTDPDTGRFHFEEGMIQAFTVTAR
jgi:hypothetical protein